MKYKTNERIIQFDIFRGIVLLYMGFVNAYYALSKTQAYGLAHDGQLMAPGDMISVYFFLMIGFNLALVQQFNHLSYNALLTYALKRGLFIMAIGAALISYTIFLYSVDLSVLFRSFLVVLGISMILMGILIFIIRKKTMIWFLLGGLCFLVMLTLPQIFSGNFTFLSPNYFIASLWGYILALLYLEKKGNPRTLLKTNLALALLSVLAGFFLSFYKHIAATRQNVSAPYVLISIGIIILLQMFIFLIHKTGTGKNKTSWLAKMGAHPLSYWILHSFVISAAVAAANLIRYYNENMISYFLQAPVTPRVIENHGVAIIASILTAGLCAWVHMNFIKTRPIV